jgi:thioredoxin 1
LLFEPYSIGKGAVMIDLEQDNLEEFIKENPKVIVQYGAGWCGNCRMIKPAFKGYAKDNEGVAFVYVDAEKMPNSRKLANVSNLPTFAGFVNGELVKQTQGNKAQIIEEVLNEIANH